MVATAVFQMIPTKRMKNPALIFNKQVDIGCLEPYSKCSVCNFKKCCILNSLDRTEDGVIWDGENGPIHSEEDKKKTSNSKED